MTKYRLYKAFVLLLIILFIFPANSTEKDDDIINNLDFFQTMQLIKDDNYSTITLIENIETTKTEQVNQSIKLNEEKK